MSIEEDLKILETRMNQLKLDYERYFLGTRPREPVLLRSEVQKVVTYYSNTAIQNTALRFRFSSLCSRYQSFKRRWDETLRQMEDGSYARHRFKAKLRTTGSDTDAPDPGDGEEREDLYSEYVEARRRCGQSVKGLSPEKLAQTLEKQRATLRKRYGSTPFRIRVVVEDGRAKLKASRERD